MRLAVFSDVHGNLSALEAVLADIAKEAVDVVVFAGDLCLVGPRPAACVQRLRDSNCIGLYGNTDDWLLGRQETPAHLQALAAWTHDQLNTGQRAWLSGLQFSHVFRPSVDERQALLVVHANPRDVNQLIFPAEDVQTARYGRIRQTDEELVSLLQGTGPGTIAFGHLHIPNVRSCEAWQLFNISSVSMPGDGDQRAKYGLFSWERNRWAFERRMVDYDAAAEVAAYRDTRPPGWQQFVATIETEGAVPQKV